MIVKTINEKGEFKIKLKKKVLNNETIIQTFEDYNIPQELKNISEEEIAFFLDICLVTDFLHADIKQHTKSLLNACWLSLEVCNISDSVLKLLSPLNMEKQYRKTDEIESLGELASYKKEDILRIKGIGVKTIKILEKQLKENALFWETPMKSIRELADDV